MGKLAAGVAIGVAATLLLAVALWLTLVYSGAYDVSAARPHADPVRWTLDKTLRRSIARRAAGQPLPGDLTEAALAEAARRYAASCVPCHGAPGQNPADWSRLMRPEPPHLVEAARHWSPGEIRWIIENGLRMTGMPAFGRLHEAGDITALAAFVARLPGLSADDYTRLTAAPDAPAAAD